MAVPRTLFTVHTTRVIIVLFLICVFLINGGITEEEIGSPLRVAQCRARCIKTFSDEVDTHKACLQDPDCYMCWENCQLLQSNFPVWGAICSKKGICFPGCQQACQFHLEKITQRAPVQVITHGEEVITLTGTTASWPRPDAASDVVGPFVYVVMRRLPGKAWKQITQTLDLSTRIPPGPTAGTIRVLVVNKDGLVTIYSPIVKSGLSGAEAIIRSLGKDGLFGLGFPLTNVAGSSGQGKRINTEIMSVTTVDPLSMLDDGEQGSWNLREVSLIHQKVLVIAEIAWDAQQTSGPAAASKSSRAVYFVTWEVDGGGLKGNLFTDSTCVTLSLWPDTVYHIQVELVTHNSQRTEQSEDLVLDTHRAVAVEFDTPMPPPAADVPTASTTPASVHGSSPHKVAVLQPRPAQLELVAGACAAVVVFLAILVALTWRWRRQHHLLHLPHHAKLIQDDYLAATPSPNLSAVYPPIVTMVGDQSVLGAASDCRPKYTRPLTSSLSSPSTAAVVAAIPNSLVSDDAATAVASTSHASV